MIAILTTVYLVVAIVFSGGIIVLMSIAAMFGSVPTSDVFKAFGFGLIWPICLAWGLVYWVYQKIRN
ncbi:hypothetical protein SEA_SHAM_187 [Streptomyces phage Sham]|nr:hypothetical protein SEA_SHAM_187 [Streptomyces phage Sham]